MDDCLVCGEEPGRIYICGEGYIGLACYRALGNVPPSVSDEEVLVLTDMGSEDSDWTQYVHGNLDESEDPDVTGIAV